MTPNSFLLFVCISLWIMQKSKWWHFTHGTSAGIVSPWSYICPHTLSFCTHESWGSSDMGKSIILTNARFSRAYLICQKGVSTCCWSQHYFPHEHQVIRSSSWSYSAASGFQGWGRVHILRKRKSAHRYFLKVSAQHLTWTAHTHSSAWNSNNMRYKEGKGLCSWKKHARSCSQVCLLCVTHSYGLYCDWLSDLWVIIHLHEVYVLVENV